MFNKTLLALIFMVFFALPCFAGPVNINMANADTLAKVMKGVGPGRAIAIVEYRTTHGPFKSIDGLLQVKGIGKKTVESNRHLLTILDENAKKSL